MNHSLTVSRPPRPAHLAVEPEGEDGLGDELLGNQVLEGGVTLPTEISGNPRPCAGGVVGSGWWVGVGVGMEVRVEGKGVWG